MSEFEYVFEMFDGHVLVNMAGKRVLLDDRPRRSRGVAAARCRSE
jgi:hypothetical protein